MTEISRILNYQQNQKISLRVVWASHSLFGQAVLDLCCCMLTFYEICFLINKNCPKIIDARKLGESRGLCGLVTILCEIVTIRASSFGLVLLTYCEIGCL